MDLNDFLNNSAILMNKEEIGALIGPDPSVFDDLFKLSFTREMPICWRAAWLTDYLSELHPFLAENYIDKAWKEIPKKHPVGVLRSTMRMLTRYDIPEKHQGIATDLCFGWLEKESVAVAIKAYSMNMLLKIAKLYPEISNELITVLEEQAPNNSIGFKARAKHIIKDLKKL